MDRAAGAGTGFVPGLHGCLLGADANLAFRRAARADPAQGQARRSRPCRPLIIVAKEIWTRRGSHPCLCWASTDLTKRERKVRFALDSSRHLCHARHRMGGRLHGRRAAGSIRRACPPARWISSVRCILRRLHAAAIRPGRSSNGGGLILHSRWPRPKLSGGRGLVSIESNVEHSLCPGRKHFDRHRPGCFLSLLEWIRSNIDVAISAPFQRAAASFAE
jgi:hypothetical protein